MPDVGSWRRLVGADEVLDYTSQGPLGWASVYDVIYDTIGVLKYADARTRLTGTRVR